MSESSSTADSFSGLFEEFSGDLCRIAWHICGRKDVAEELCQEAFLKYYERRAQLPGGDEGRYWLIRVVKNLALNYEKRRKREHLAYHAYEQIPQKSVNNETEETILNQESREMVRKAILDLPYKLRIALILKEFADYRYAQIAKILNISENNVKIRIFRARKHLAGKLVKGEIHVP